MREHLETFLTTVREERGKDLPRYVEQELRRYLRCGIFLCVGRHYASNRGPERD